MPRPHSNWRGTDLTPSSRKWEPESLTGGGNVSRTIEGVIDEQGNGRLLEPSRPGTPRRALVTILDERPAPSVSETALLSEPALAEDWNRPDEDEAWAHLQEER